MFVAPPPSDRFPVLITFAQAEVSFHSWGGDPRRAGRGDLPGLGFSFCLANPQMGNPLGDPRGLAGCHLHVAKCDGPSLQRADPKRGLARGTGAPYTAPWGLCWAASGDRILNARGPSCFLFCSLGDAPSPHWRGGPRVAARQASSCSGISRQVYPPPSALAVVYRLLGCGGRF